MDSTNFIMTVDSLVEFGFKEYKVNSIIDKFDRNWQYCVRDNRGKKFFVTVRFWNFSKYTSSENKVNDSFDATCQFDMRGPKTFDVSLSVCDMTPAQVINWFETMFNRMNCRYYELFDSDLFDDEGIKQAHNCLQCNIYLGKEPQSEFCENCSYELETGFKIPLVRYKKTKSY